MHIPYSPLTIFIDSFVLTIIRDTKIISEPKIYFKYFPYYEISDSMKDINRVQSVTEKGNLSLELVLEGLKL